MVKYQHRIMWLTGWRGEPWVPSRPVSLSGTLWHDRWARARCGSQWTTLCVNSKWLVSGSLESSGFHWFLVPYQLLLRVKKVLWNRRCFGKNKITCTFFKSYRGFLNLSPVFNLIEDFGHSNLEARNSHWKFEIILDGSLGFLGNSAHFLIIFSKGKIHMDQNLSCEPKAQHGNLQQHFGWILGLQARFYISMGKWFLKKIYKLLDLSLELFLCFKNIF
jgi:hypothetical protein